MMISPARLVDVESYKGRSNDSRRSLPSSRDSKSHPLTLQQIYPHRMHPHPEDGLADLPWQTHLAECCQRANFQGLWAVWKSSTTGAVHRWRWGDPSVSPAISLDDLLTLETTDILRSSPKAQLTPLSPEWTGIGQAVYVSPYGNESNYLIVWNHESISPLQEWCLLQQIELLEQMQTRAQERSQVYDTLHTINHQLRTPLALIGLYADVLAQSLLESRWVEHAHCIRHAVDEVGTSLTRFIQANDTANEAATLQRQNHDLRQLVQDCIADVQPWIQSKQLQIHCSQQRVILSVDGWQLKQAIGNLLNNAIYFSPTGSTITCRWHRFQTEAILQISDQGPGLSLDDLQKMFTPHYTRRPGGSGLGLAIAQQMIQAHQGRIWADNLPTGGTQISICLPCRSLS